MEKVETNNLPSLVEVISVLIQAPGVRVNRTDFLEEQFKNASPDLLNLIRNVGPVEAGCSREELYKKASSLVHKKSLLSSGASFLAGLPGGFAMAAAIPADVMQFYGVSLRLAQEVSYLYGAEDLWSGDVLDEEKVINQLILYCGVMLGAAGAAQTVRVLASALAKQATVKIPQQALTKTVYYPVIKSIVRYFGGKMTKDAFAKIIAKAVPVVGGVISGTITFVSLRPMGKRLISTFDEAIFVYSEDDYEADLEEIVRVSEVEFDVQEPEIAESTNSILDTIQKAKEMLDAGVITQEEFAEIKRKLILEM